MAWRSALGWAAGGILAASLAANSPAGAGAPTVSAENSANAVPATPALVRQVQFMLLSIGIDPGPIDGIPRQRTDAAIHKFEQRAALPDADLVENGQISTALLDNLRKAASGVLLGAQPQPPATAATAPTAPAAPAKPPVDRYAACPYDPRDFLIGGQQYTPQSFLQTGFAGSTAVAVDSLKDRLQEARQVAQQIGGPALMEVQRQAKVLQYFECRLKIEQASAVKN